MTGQTIQSQDIRVADAFQAFYVVPDYQREYVWGAEQVEQLLDDVNTELQSARDGDAPEYFIGSIVVCPGRGATLELIDGQQRMTTLFIVLCAIRDYLKSIGEPAPGPLANQISASSVNADGDDENRYRIDLQYEDSGGLMARIAEGTGDGRHGGTHNTRSMVNIGNAYETVGKFLTREFCADPKAAKRFYAYLTNKVKLIRILTEDVAKALKVFETINDRGVGLDSMDLLKNLLFRHANTQRFGELKETWKQLQDTIHEAGEKPLRFLRYFVLSRYDVDRLREDEIYKWFTDHEAECGYKVNPIGFSTELLSAASDYRNFLLGRDKQGKPNSYLESMGVLGGRAARQHLILLMAGRHLRPDLFDQLVHEVENLFFSYVVTREPTRDFERNFALWATELRCARDHDAFEAFVHARFVTARAALSARFGDALRRLKEGELQGYRLAYVLAKLTQHVDLEAYGANENTRWLRKYVAGGFEIEHIYPRNPSTQASAEFGTDSGSAASRLGNLVLVEKSINGALGNRSYSAKRPVYLQSQLLLTRSLAEPQKVGVNTRIDTAARDLKSFADWNEQSIEQRQEMLLALARHAWNVP